MDTLRFLAASFPRAAILKIPGDRVLLAEERFTVDSSSTLYHLPPVSTRSSAGIYGEALGVVLAAIGGVLWATTQWFAWRLDFDPALGPSLFEAPQWLRPLLAVGAGVAGMSGLAALLLPRARGLAPWLCAITFVAGVLAVGPAYAPWQFLVWDWRLGDQPALQPLFTTGHWAIAIPSHGALFLAIWVASRRARNLGGRTDSHGSARWASEADVEGSGLTTGRGVFLATRKRGRGGLSRYLRHDGPQHVLGFAPSRSGKGVGWVIPTLLTWPESVVVHDIKGENWALTAGWRKEGLGSLCLRFDPTCRDGSAARYNPLLEVRRGPDEVRDVQNIADMLVDPDGAGGKDHWDLTAQDLLVGTILHVLYSRSVREKSLRACLELLSDPGRPFEDVLDEMIETEHDPTQERGWVERATGRPTRTHPVVAGAARALQNKSDNERSSVVSTALRCLGLFRDEIVAANTVACDFSVLDLVHHERPVSLYLTVPPSDLARTRPLVRLLIHQIGRRLTERMTFEGSGAAPAARRRLLLLMDEFPALGRLDFFRDQLAYLPGYGIQAFLVVQDLSQLYAAYGREESIVSNCAVRVAFAPNRIETAKLLSDMAGTMTVHRSRRMYSGNRLSPWLFHVMASEEESQRPLLTPDEALRLPDDAALLFASGRRPILAEKVRYYEDPRLLERARIPAPAVSDRVPIEGSDWWSTSSGVAGPTEQPDATGECRVEEAVTTVGDRELVGEPGPSPDIEDPAGARETSSPGGAQHGSSRLL